METEPTPTNQPAPSKRRPFSKTPGGIILRIFLVLITGGVIGAVIYFTAAGWVPYLEQRIYGPIRSNQDQVLTIEATLDALEEELAAIAQYQGESQLIYQQDLEASLTAAAEEIAELEMAVTSLIAQSYTQVPARIATLTAGQQNNADHLSALATAQMQYLLSRPEDDLLKINALLSRANQYLLHANYGLVEEQLLLAKQILLEMAEDQSDGELAHTMELIALIENSLEDLPEQPTLAAAKLELAWQLSLLGFELTSDQGTPTPTPNGSGTATPTPN